MFEVLLHIRCIETVKLYPGGNAQTGMQLRGRGCVYFYCNRHGLFRQKV